MINCLSKCKKTQDLNLVRSSKIVMLKHYTVLPIKAKSDKIKKKKKGRRVRRRRRQDTGEKIFAKETSDKGLFFKAYKNP